MGNSIKPAEVKSQVNQGRKRAGGLLKIQDADGPETQPPPFTIDLPEHKWTPSVSKHLFFPALTELQFHFQSSGVIPTASPLPRAGGSAPSGKWRPYKDLETQVSCRDGEEAFWRA